MNLEQIVYNLPSTQTFMDSVCNSTGATVAVIPNDLSRQMVGRLVRERLESDRRVVGESLRPSGDEPLAFTVNLLNLAWPDPLVRRNVANLLRLDNLPDVLYVERIPTADPAERQAWTQFIEDWARECRSRQESHDPVRVRLIVLAKLKDFDQLPESESSVQFHWWLGFPSTLEMRLACRTADENSDADDATRRWREHILPGLATSDVQLAEHLWDAVIQGTSDVVNSLAGYWTDPDRVEFSGDLSEVIDLVNILGKNFSPDQGPPPELRRLWDCGGLVYTPEYGFEVHPALLAASGRDSDVEHRIWRGQAELLLPYVNEIRLAVCQSMTDEFGSDWPIRWEAPSNDEEREAARRNPNATELGYLDKLLSQTGKGSERHPLDARRHLAPLVSLTRDVRNTIAHYHPVEPEKFMELYFIRTEAGI